MIEHRAKAEDDRLVGGCDAGGGVSDRPIAGERVLDNGVRRRPLKNQETMEEIKWLLVRASFEIWIHTLNSLILVEHKKYPGFIN